MNLNVDERTRVLVLEPRGAVPDYIAQFSSALAMAGVDVTVVSAPPTSGRSFPRAENLRYVPAFALETNGGVRNLRPYLRGWGVVVITLLRDRPHVLHVQWFVKPWLEARILPFLSRLTRSTLIVTVHNVVPHDAPRVNSASFRRLYRRAQRLIVHTEAAAKHLRRVEPAIEARKVVVVPHGNFDLITRVDIASEDARGLLGVPAEGVLVAAPGKIRPYKGLIHLIEAMERLSPGSARLLIAGAPDDSAYSAELTRRAAESSADVIVLARYLTREEFDSCFIAADVIAMPYLAIDQSGVMLYAMTAGKAIVASRLPAFVETLGDTGGELVEPGSVEDIAHALCQLVADPNLRKRYGSAARQIASKRHEWSAVAARTIAVYKSCALS